MLDEVAEHLPAYFHFISAAYSSPSHLFFRDHLIPSQRGVQQGDPLGPALFPLTLHPIVSAITNELNIWYLDDGTVAGAPEELLESFHLIREKGREIGLFLNEDKCELAVLGAHGSKATEVAEAFHDEALSLQVFDVNDAVLLGAPISDEVISSILSIKTESLGILAKWLRCLRPLSFLPPPCVSLHSPSHLLSSVCPHMEALGLTR